MERMLARFSLLGLLGLAAIANVVFQVALFG